MLLDQIEREEDRPVTPQNEEALVKKLIERVKKDKAFFKADFERMRMCHDLVKGVHWPNQTEKDERYLANVIRPFVAQRSARLFAKNPTLYTRVREQLDYHLWDGSSDSLMKARELVAMANQVMGAGAAIPPEVALEIQQAAEILADYQQSRTRRSVKERLGKSLEILVNYFWAEQSNLFHVQAKAAVARAVVTGVAYVKTDFQREINYPGNVERQLQDSIDRLATLKRLSQDVQHDPTKHAEVEELEHAVRAMQGQGTIAREGLVWSWPRSCSVIPDCNAKSLAGWDGARWVTEEYLFDKDQIKEHYGKDLGDQDFVKYSEDGDSSERESILSYAGMSARRDSRVCVWEIQDKQTGLVYTVADGVSYFLERPRAPNVSLEGFFNIRALTFSEVGQEDLFPRSDVYFMMHPQRDINRALEARRQHRHANRPLYLAAPGFGDEDEMETLQHAPAHAILSTRALEAGQKVTDVFSDVPRAGLDPNMYETGSSLTMMLMTAGAQESTFGGTSGATATESSIAETAQLTTVEMNQDDLDQWLSGIARDSGQICLSEMSYEQVVKIVGPAAIWPRLTLTEIVSEVFLDVRAGSSGRPNQASAVQIFNQLWPALSTIPGISHLRLAEEAVKLLQANLEVADFLDPGKPSILAANQAAARGILTGGAGSALPPEAGSVDPVSDPAAQGNEGAISNRAAPSPRDQARPARPAPGATPGDRSNFSPV